MQCNIDARGKAARLISGILTCIFAVVAWWLWGWIVGVVLLVFGAFQIFEARAGWCVVRAMGFKTPM